MKLLTIERNSDTKQLEVVFSFNDNITIAIPIIDKKITELMIISAAQSLNQDADFFVSQYKEKINDLKIYSEYRRKILQRIYGYEHNEIMNTIICGGILSMSEIYWFDWYIKKNKLTGGIDG